MKITAHRYEHLVARARQRTPGQGEEARLAGRIGAAEEPASTTILFGMVSGIATDPVSTELEQLFQEDQDDRRNNIPPDQLARRDARRRERVLQVYRGRQLATPEHHYHAAMIMYHGPEIGHAWLGHELAAAAGQEKSPVQRAALWLRAATLDRYLVLQGAPQRYGTQTRGSHFLPTDPATTDGERVKHGVPPLSWTKVMERAMNAKDPLEKALWEQLATLLSLWADRSPVAAGTLPALYRDNSHGEFELPGLPKSSVNGREEIKRLLAQWAASPFHLIQFVFHEQISLERRGGNMIIVRFPYTLSGELYGERMSQVGTSQITFLREKGEWQVLNHLFLARETLPRSITPAHT